MGIYNVTRQLSLGSESSNKRGAVRVTDLYRLLLSRYQNSFLQSVRATGREQETLPVPHYNSKLKLLSGHTQATLFLCLFMVLHCMQAVTSLPVCSHTTGSDTRVPDFGQLGWPVCNFGMPSAHAPPGQAAQGSPAGGLPPPAMAAVHLTAAGYQLAQGAAERLGTPCTTT